MSTLAPDTPDFVLAVAEIAGRMFDGDLERQPQPVQDSVWRDARAALVAALARLNPQTDAPPSVLPRPFLLFRIRDVSGTSGTGIVAWGTQFPDGAAALRWNGPHPSTAAWPSVEDILAVHGHQGATVIRWLDTTIGGN